jgi:endonuclease YncB( thermonuclease family)
MGRVFYHRITMANPFPTLALLLLLAGPASAATVLSVGDGDTLRVDEGGNLRTVRLACIDAPEAAQRPYGAASRQRLQELAPVGSVVSLRPHTIDRYGRTVAEVFRNGQSVNLAMVFSGQAFAYRQHLGTCNRPAYLEAEATAQRQMIGVWAVAGGLQRPWDWRNGVRLSCQQIGSYARAQELLRQGHTYLDKNGDGIACDTLR